MANKKTVIKEESEKNNGDVTVDATQSEQNGSKNFQSTLDGYSKYLDETEGKTRSTIKSYVGDISDFFKYLTASGIDDTMAISRDIVLSYKNELIAKNARAATVNTVLNSLRSFNLFASKQGFMKETVVDTKTDRVTNQSIAEMRTKEKTST